MAAREERIVPEPYSPLMTSTPSTPEGEGPEGEPGQGLIGRVESPVPLRGVMGRAPGRQPGHEQRPDGGDQQGPPGRAQRDELGPLGAHGLGQPGAPGPGRGAAGDRGGER